MSYPAAYVDGEALTAARLNQFTALWLNAIATRERCALRNTTAQAILNTTLTIITFDTEDVDVGGMHSSGGRVTIPSGSDGFYTAVGKTTFVAGAGNQRLVAIYKNGVLHDQVKGANNSSIDPGLECTFNGALVATDYLELVVYQDSGGSLNTTPGLAYTSLTVTRQF